MTYFRWFLAIVFIGLFIAFLAFKYTNVFDKLCVEPVNVPKFTALGFWLEKANPSEAFAKALGESGRLLKDKKRQRGIGVFGEQNQKGDIDMFIGFVLKDEFAKDATQLLSQLNEQVDKSLNLGDLVLIQQQRLAKGAMVVAEYKSALTVMLTPMRVYPMLNNYFVENNIGIGEHEKPFVEFYDCDGVDFPGSHDAPLPAGQHSADLRWCRYIAYVDRNAISGPWQQ